MCSMFSPRVLRTEQNERLSPLIILASWPAEPTSTGNCDSTSATFVPAETMPMMLAATSAMVAFNGVPYESRHTKQMLDFKVIIRYQWKGVNIVVKSEHSAGNS